MTPTRIAVILPGLGRVQRGAETAFIEIAHGLDAYKDIEVEIFGSGEELSGNTTFHSIPCTPRERFERWPKLPVFRSECHYEEFSFCRALKRSKIFNPENFDVALHCSYPFVNWFIQKQSRKSPLLSVFVTENGDWMCHARRREYRYFQCDGLVCTTEEYFERNRELHDCVLIPNGANPVDFHPRGTRKRPADFCEQNGWPRDKPVVLMASAMIPSKRVIDGVRAVAKVPEAFMVLAGDGPERDNVAQEAEKLLPGRHLLMGSLPRERMPGLLRQADVYLHMSQDEPASIARLEAAASELPVIMHDDERARWFLDGVAIFVHTSKLDEVADAIRTAMDPATRETLGPLARQRVLDKWSWQAIVEQYRTYILKKLGREDSVPTSEGENDALDRDRQLQHV